EPGTGEDAGERAAPSGVPDPELVEQAKPRNFTGAYKLWILREARRAPRGRERSRHAATRGPVHVARHGVAQAAGTRGAQRSMTQSLSTASWASPGPPWRS